MTHIFCHNDLKNKPQVDEKEDAPSTGTPPIVVRQTPGLEPGPVVLETTVLPLHHAAQTPPHRTPYKRGCGVLPAGLEPAASRSGGERSLR